MMRPNSGGFCQYRDCLEIIHHQWGVYECDGCQRFFCAQHLMERPTAPNKVCPVCLEMLTQIRINA
jgi:hypothetical protein